VTVATVLLPLRVSTVTLWLEADGKIDVGEEEELVELDLEEEEELVEEELLEELVVLDLSVVEVEGVEITVGGVTEGAEIIGLVVEIASGFVVMGVTGVTGVVV
jgi:hypothetical protein